MRSGEHDIARAYVLYREKRAQARAARAAQKRPRRRSRCCTCVENGERRPLDLAA